MGALQLHQVSWRPHAADRPVLDGVTLQVEPGAVLGLLGPSGSGKTSLLRVVAGLQAPSRGRVAIDGQDVTALAASLRPVGLVAQEARLFPDLSVLDNVAFRLRLMSQREAALRAAAQALETLGIESLGPRRPHELSEGERQRVALARAIATKPSVLLLDEPMSHLDRRLRRALGREILALRDRLDLSLVYVTHDQNEAMAICDRIALFQQGRVVQEGTPRALYESPSSDFAAAFMGDMRLFEGWSDGRGTVQVGPLCVMGRSGAPHQAGRVQVVVRPHDWQIVPASTPGLPARVLGSAWSGRHLEYRVRSDLGDLLVIGPATPRRHEVGAPVSLTLTDRGVSVLPA